MDTIRVALAQLAPVLGELDRNLQRHHELLDQARAEKADLVVFPELGLTGYQLQDLAAEVSMRLDDPRLAELAAATKDLSAIVSFVEESADHRLFIAAALLEDGEIRHVHRKLYLPTYLGFDPRIQVIHLDDATWVIARAALADPRVEKLKPAQRLGQVGPHLRRDAVA